MARYVLVEFEDDEKAESFRRMVDSQTRQEKSYRVAGIFARPKKFCECPVPEGYHPNLVLRGQKFGWNTCVVCKRAKPGSHNANNLAPINLLLGMPDYELPFEYRVDNIAIFEVPVKNIERAA